MRYNLLLFILICPTLLFAQRKVKDSVMNIPLIGAQYAVQLPGGNMSELYGLNSTVGGSFYFKAKSNFIFGFEFNYLFGSNVKMDPTLSIATEQKFLINANGAPQLLELYERGYLPLLKIGKIFPVFGPNKNSGLMFKVGGGMLQHHIKYYYPGNAPPQLHGDYVKGYDRLTSGTAFTESIGYFHLSNRNAFNFSIELESIQAFTQNRRIWNFDEMKQDDEKKLDLLFGIKAAWYFPIYRKSSEQYYY